MNVYCYFLICVIDFLIFNSYRFNISPDHQLYKGMLLIVNLQCNHTDSSTGMLDF